jgi:hypothetical protein
MEQQDESEEYAESVDLEQFVYFVRGLPAVSKDEIDRLLADQMGKRASKPNLSSN